MPYLGINALCMRAAAADPVADGQGAGPSGTIYVIRHGEKITSGDHLNKTGWARAEYVAELWGGGPGSRYASPRAIFANFFKDEYNSVELAAPLALKLGLTVNSSYHRPHWGADNRRAARAMLSALDETGGPILAIWESYNMVPLVRDLGCRRPWMAKYDQGNWGDFLHTMTQYDRFFILELRNGTCASVHLEREFFDNRPTWATSSKLQPFTPFPLVTMVGSILLVFLVAAWMLRSLCKSTKICAVMRGLSEEKAVALLDGQA